MSDLNYYRESNRCSTNLRRIEEARKKLEKVGSKIPSHLEDKINLAKSQRKEAEKKYSFPYRRIVEATEEMQEAANSTNDVLDSVYELYFGYLYPKACEARDSYSDYEYLAAKHIPNYSIHKKNFRIIEKRRKNNEKLSWVQVSSDCDCLQNFLKDFDSVKEELAAEIKEKKEEKREREEAKKEATERFRISTGLTCVVIFLSIITIVVMVKGCSDSSQQTAQPEASTSETELQSAENNTTPNL